MNPEHDACEFITRFNIKILMHYRLKLLRVGLGVYRKFASFILDTAR